MLPEDTYSGPLAVLVDVGTLDDLADQAKGRDKVIVETSGYGIQEIAPFFMAVDLRYKSTSKIISLNSALTDGMNVHTSNNPSRQQGTGGSCFGDSGGPMLVNNTNLVVGIVSFGFSLTCRGSDWAYRADITDTHDFVGPFLSQPISATIRCVWGPGPLASFARLSLGRGQRRRPDFLPRYPRAQVGGGRLRGR